MTRIDLASPLLPLPLPRWWGPGKSVSSGDTSERNESDEVYLPLQRIPKTRTSRSRLPLRMLRNVSSAVSAILLTLALLLSSALGKDVGERCTVDNFNPGVCKLLSDCPTVYAELLSGIAPKTTCGYMGFDPIVCCPTTNATPKPTSNATPKPTSNAIPKPTTSSVTTAPSNMVLPLTISEGRGALARAKCAENAEAVYGLELPPTLSINRTPVNTSRCALKTRKLIVGGKKAGPKEFPHMTAIGFGPDNNNNILWLCGGTLISSKIVLTAAHCTYQSEWGRAKWARVGDLNLAAENDDARPQTIKITERIRHPQYKRPSEYHDIAVLKLESEVVFNAWVRPACLPVDLPDVGVDNKAVATGWGRVEWAEETGSENLLKVTLSLVSHRSCNQSFSDGGSSGQLPRGIVNEWQICAGELGKDTCQGDSGGPLAIFNTVHDCMYNVIGITSLGRYCGSIIPGVYTRVYHYIPWIEKVAWPEYF